MRIALAQLNPLIGDLEGNGERILAACQRAAQAGADLVLTPELSLWGYPPRDLLLRPALVRQQHRQLEQLARSLPPGIGALVGMADPVPGMETPRLWNALALLNDGGWTVVAHKRLLPSYDVFDETRYFQPGQQGAWLEWQQGERLWNLGLSICEDLWVEQELQEQRLAGVDPIGELAKRGVDLLLNLSASPYARGKLQLRRQLAARAAARVAAPVLYVNQVGGNDELVFDGASFVVDAAGQPLWQGACGREQLAIWDTEQPQMGCEELDLGRAQAKSPAGPTAQHDPQGAAGKIETSTQTPETTGLQPVAGIRSFLAAESEHRTTTAVPGEQEQMLRALVLGVRDYAHKCGFQGALLGLSGGIDSALVAVLACAALGPVNVKALRMPSPWSSPGSLEDAQALADRLQLGLHTVPIEELMHSFDRALTPALGGEPSGVTAENLQSRIRGTLLMALANQQGKLLLSTGNKSELAVGYCTLYGDMNGGLAVIGDLYKTTVFALCDWIDSPESKACRADLGLPAQAELIGEAIRHKPPSAELRPEQKDSDSLPDYSVLDALLRQYIETMATPEQVIATGVDPQLAQRVQQLLRRAEFKRRQTAPVLKVSGRSFGGGWRMPIAAR
jgi:NAD+ synthase (glutamine-hydrolysing)